MKLATPVFETERLIAREMSPDDLDFVASMLADPEVMRFYPRCYSRAEARGWIERQSARYRDHGHGLWLVSDRRTGESVGQVGVLRQVVEGKPEAEIGYLIARSFWRQGFATEAARAARDYAFARLNRSYVISLIRPANLPSQGVARKLGMQLERTVSFNGIEHQVFRSRGIFVPDSHRPM